MELKTNNLPRLTRRPDDLSILVRIILNQFDGKRMKSTLLVLDRFVFLKRNGKVTR